MTGGNLKLIWDVDVRLYIMGTVFESSVPEKATLSYESQNKIAMS